MQGNIGDKNISRTSEQIKNTKQGSKRSHFVNLHLRLEALNFDNSVESCISEEKTISLTSEQMQNEDRKEEKPLCQSTCENRS